MSLKLAGRLFTGPVPLATAQIRKNQDPALYMIVAKEGVPWDPVFRLIEVGETGESGVVFGNHPRRAQWEECGEVAVYLYAMPRWEGFGPDERAQAVQEIRAEGERHAGVIPIGAMP